MDLPNLTAKQLEFVKSMLAGMTASDAYRHAYDCANMADETIWARASELRRDSKVAAWLAHARALALTEATMTKEAYLQELADLQRQCIENGNYGAAVKALELRGKVDGHYIEKHEDVTKRPDPQKTYDELVAIIGPDMARAIRDKARKRLQ